MKLKHMHLNCLKLKDSYWLVGNQYIWYFLGINIIEMEISNL